MKRHEKNLENNATQKLQDIAKDDMMEYERALELELFMVKRSKIIKDHIEKVHPINQLNNGRYYTKLHPQDYKKPGLVNKANIGDVEEAIYQYYLGKENKRTDKIAFGAMYQQWHDDPIGGGKVKPVTMYRIENMYKQYLEKSALVNTPIKKISIDEFELFFLDCLKQGITRKAFINLKSIINKVYNYAIRKEIVVKHSKDMFKSLELPKNEFKTTEKKPCQLSFNPEEVAVLRKYILDNYLSSKNRLQPLAMLGVLFTFFTGVRVGELAALKVSDYDSNNSMLLIERTETRNQKEKKKDEIYSGKPPKTLASNRNIYLSSDAREILKLIFSVRETMGIQSEFLFTDRDGNRLHCPRFIKTIEILNMRTGLPYKRSMHDIRRTYASICFLNDVPLHVIQRQLGHETMQQTMDYIKDLISEQEGRKFLEGAVLFTKSPEHLQGNEHGIAKDNVIDFRAKIDVKPHKQAH